MYPTAPSDLRLISAGPEGSAAWDRFVEAHPEGRFCQLWGFKRVLEEVYGYRCIYLNIVSGERRVGIFPSILVRRGNGRLISLPFQEYGGPLLDDLSEHQQRYVAGLLLGAAQQEGCSAVEIRGGTGCEKLAGTDLCVRQPLHAYAVLNLAPEMDLWRHSLTSEARKGVNRARKAGLTGDVRLGQDAVSDPFYALYLVSMRRLGVPPHPLQFFRTLADGLGRRLVASWVEKRGEPVAVLLGAVTGRRIQIYVTASDSSAWSLRPNDLAHWELIRWAASSGLRLFDFGSARYSGQIQFKKKWGSTLHEYAYYSIAPANGSGSGRVKQLTETSSPFFVGMSHLWRRVVPDPVAKVLGRPIRRYLTK